LSSKFSLETIPQNSVLARVASESV